jgi:predicted nucleotide-binding protein
MESQAIARQATEQMMPTTPVIDQEFVVHLFAPLGGPQARPAYRQVRQVWTACSDRLGISQPVAGLPGTILPAQEQLGLTAADGVLAIKEGQAAVRQAVLRRAHDVLNVSVALAQSVPEGRAVRATRQLAPIRPKTRPARSRMGWADYAALWAQASQPRSGAVLGETHLFLARTLPGRTGPVAAVAELGQALEPLLPYREDRAPHWWRRGSTTSAGYAVWDTGLAPDTGTVREIIVVAPADRDEELSGWVWSDGTPAMPPFARYLMNAGKLRYEARLLDAWHQAKSPGEDVEILLTELEAMLGPGKHSADSAAPLDSLRGRLRAEERRLASVDGELARLEHTVSLAQRNLLNRPDCDAADGDTGMFAADQSLAKWLTGQIGSDRAYLAIDLSQVKSATARAAEESQRLRASDPSAPTAPAAADVPAARAAADAPSADIAPTSGPAPNAGRRVFVVYGRDSALTRSFFDLLYGVGLEPLEWETIVGSLRKPMPSLVEAVLNAPKIAQAALVLLSPDDIVKLHPDLYGANDHRHERAEGGQARPNVLFELGLAYMAYPERTVIVEVGLMRPIADLAGLNVVRFDGSAMAVRKVLERLTLAGCPVDMSRTGWLDEDRFKTLGAYRRGPGTGGAQGDSGA